MNTRALEGRMNRIERAVAKVKPFEIEKYANEPLMKFTGGYIFTWVDAKKRLPEEAGRYLIYAKAVKKNGITIAYYDPEMGWWLVSSLNIRDITHWMPLPKPPEGE